MMVIFCCNIKQKSGALLKSDSVYAIVILKQAGSLNYLCKEEVSTHKLESDAYKTPFPLTSTIFQPSFKK